MVTLDYESPYLLPWLAYHRLIGFDYVMLYLDDPAGTSMVKHPRILKLLAATDWVKVETKCQAHTDEEGTSHMSLIHRCASSARELGVLWVANWDVDEWPCVSALRRGLAKLITCRSRWKSARAEDEAGGRPIA